MAKKPSNQIKSIPEIYTKLPNDPAALRKDWGCIVEDVHFLFYIFKNKESCHLIKEAIAKVFDCFDTFADLPKQTLLTYHENFFKCNPPEDQALVTTALYCWHYMRTIAVDRRPTVPVTTTGRRAETLSSTYTEGPTVEGYGTGELEIRTPQAIECIKLFRECIREKQDLDTANAERANAQLPTDYVASITEAELQKFITDRASRLRTRQEPWRIFAYYRNQLLNAGILKRS